MIEGIQSIEAKVVVNKQVQPGYFDMTLFAPDIAAAAKPGQFLMIRPGKQTDPLLGRPMGIYDWDKQQGVIQTLYAVKGKGTALLAAAKPGDKLPVVAPLGRSYRFYEEDKRVIVLAGGVGIAPLFPVIRYLKDARIKTDILLGARTADEVLSMEKLGELGLAINVFTDDGTMGVQGYPADALKELLQSAAYDRVYTCGPMVMMERVAAICEAAGIPCQVSLEERMGCGIGICMGCVCYHKNADGSTNLARVCYEGPVFDSKEVVWHG